MRPCQAARAAERRRTYCRLAAHLTTRVVRYTGIVALGKRGAEGACGNGREVLSVPPREVLSVPLQACRRSESKGASDLEILPRRGRARVPHL